MILNRTKTECRSDNQRFINAATIFILAFVLSFFIVMVKAYFDGEFDSVASLQAYITRFGMFGPLMLIAIQIMQVIVPVLPGFLGCAVGAILFGPIVGFWCNYIGIGVGSIIAFFLARRFGMPLLQELFPSGKYDKWSNWASRSRSYSAFLFVAMLLPLFPDDYLCYLTGVSRMTARRFIGIIIVGKPWCLLAYSFGFSLIQ